MQQNQLPYGTTFLISILCRSLLRIPYSRRTKICCQIVLLLFRLDKRLCNVQTGREITRKLIAERAPAYRLFSHYSVLRLLDYY